MMKQAAIYLLIPSNLLNKMNAAIRK